MEMFTIKEKPAILYSNTVIVTTDTKMVKTFHTI